MLDRMSIIFLVENYPVQIGFADSRFGDVDL